MKFGLKNKKNIMNRLYFEFDQKSDLIFTMIDPIPRT